MHHRIHASPVWRSWFESKAQAAARIKPYPVILIVPCHHHPSSRRPDRTTTIDRTSKKPPLPLAPLLSIQVHYKNTVHPEASSHWMGLLFHKEYVCGCTPRWLLAWHHPGCHADGLTSLSGSPTDLFSRSSGQAYPLL